CCASPAIGAARMLPPTMVMNARRSINLCSLDDLVGSGQDRLRDRQAERLGRLQVDGQIESRWPLHWQVPGFSPLKDLAYKPRSPTIDVLYVRPVRDEAAATHKLLPLVNGGHAMIRRTLDDVSSLNIEHGID